MWIIQTVGDPTGWELLTFIGAGAVLAALSSLMGILLGLVMATPFIIFGLVIVIVLAIGGWILSHVWAVIGPVVVVVVAFLYTVLWYVVRIAVIAGIIYGAYHLVRWYFAI